MITEFSDLDAAGVVRAVNEMLEDGEFPVMTGMRVTGCGGMGFLLPTGSLPLVNGQSFATIGTTQYHIPDDSHGCPACPHSVTGTFVAGSATRFCHGVPIVTLGSLGVHTGCCGPNQAHATDALITPIDIHDVFAMPH